MTPLPSSDGQAEADLLQEPRSAPECQEPVCNSKASSSTPPSSASSQRPPFLTAAAALRPGPGHLPAAGGAGAAVSVSVPARSGLLLGAVCMAGPPHPSSVLLLRTGRVCRRRPPGSDLSVAGLINMFVPLSFSPFLTPLPQCLYLSLTTFAFSSVRGSCKGPSVSARTELLCVGVKWV